MKNNKIYKNFKIIVAGASQTGKTMYTNTILHSGKVPSSTLPTLGVEITPIPYKYPQGYVTFNVWDVAGHYKGTNHEGHFIGAQGALIFYKENDKVSYNEALDYEKKIKRIARNIPIIFVKSGTTNIEPIQSLGRKLLKMPSLELKM
jgi:GTPase SAR1 family protein